MYAMDDQCMYPIIIKIHVVFRVFLYSCLRSAGHATWIVDLLAVLLAIHQLSQATLVLVVETKTSVPT